MTSSIRIASYVVGWLIAGNSWAVGAERTPMELVLQMPMTTAVNSVATSPDGNLVAATGGENGIRLYDAKSGRLLRVMGNGDRSVVFSADSRTIVAAGFQMDKLTWRYDVATGSRLKSYAGHSEIETYAVALSPDGKRIASAGREDKMVLVWDIDTGKLIHRISVGANPAVALAFSPDSATLASGGGDRIVQLWDMQTGELRQTFKGHNDWICALAFSADGKKIASGSCDFAYHRGRDPDRFEWDNPIIESQLNLWNLSDGSLQRSIIEKGRLLSLSLSNDGKLVTFGLDKAVRLYNLENPGLGKTIAMHDALVTSVAFTKDSDSVISGGHDHVIQRTDVRDGRTLWRNAGFLEQVNSVSLSQDGSLLVTGSSDERFAKKVVPYSLANIGGGATRLWDVKKGQLVRQFGDASIQIMATAILPDKKIVISAGINKSGLGSVQAWDLDSGNSVWSAEDHASEVLTVAHSLDGSMLATGSADGELKLRESKSGKVIKVMNGHEGGATSVVFSPDGEYLVCGMGNGGSRIWDAKSGELLHDCPNVGSRAKSIKVDRMMTTVALFAGGQQYAECLASMGNTYSDPIRFLEIKTGRIRNDIHIEGLRSGRPIVFSPNGRMLATGGKTIELWDMASGKSVRKLSGHLKKIQTIAFSQDGRLIFGGGNYGTVNIWDVESGELLATLFTFGNKLPGQATDEWMAYHPSGFFAGSDGVESRVAWRVGDELKTPATIGRDLNRPQKIAAALTAVGK